MNGQNPLLDNPNLNPIPEEFDLSDRIKSLKGKHIKIKKIVKKEDGNYSIRETSLFSEKSIELPPQEIGGSLAGNFKDTIVQSSNYQPLPDNILPTDFNSIKNSTYITPQPAIDFMKKSIDLRPAKMGSTDNFLPPNIKKDFNARAGVFSSTHYSSTNLREIPKDPYLARLDSYSST